jgi:Sulfotransferase family
MLALAGPNFFIAGAPKAGTTSLYHNLRQHPQIFMSPVKEPSFFASETRVENYVPEVQAMMRAHMERVQLAIRQGQVANNETRGIVAEWSDYIQLFEGVTSEKAAGEASVSYLWSKTAPQAIATRIPQAKIILILRHPAERAFSQYLHYVSDGHITHSFSKHIEACLHSNEVLGPFYPFLQFGLYAEQVERYFSLFPQEQIRIWLYEDTLKDPQSFLREVFEFLEVDSQFAPNTTKRYQLKPIPRAMGIMQAMRRTRAWKTMQEHCPAALRPLLKRAVYVPRGTVRMTPEERRFLVDYYRADVGRLQQMLGQDLAAWMA